MREEETRPKSRDEQADFVMSFIEDSDDARSDLEDVWEVVEQNFLVRPFEDTSTRRNTNNPLDQNSLHQRPARSVLKDPETHQEIMTIVSNIVLSTMPEPGYVRAQRVGFEDIPRAKVADGLIEHSDRLPGAFGTNIDWVLSAGVYGTGVKEIFWDYVEEPRRFRQIIVNEFTGEEESSFETLVAPVYDDVREEVMDVRDFFPDPGQSRMDMMLGAARRFKISAAKMRSRVEAKIYKNDPVERAIERRVRKDSKENEDKPGGDELDLSYARESHPDFMVLTGYRYIGLVPWHSPDGFQRREVVVIGGETVRSEPWLRRVPWFDIRITPRLNSFWGISPGEINRYDQDLADTIKMMLADAVILETHPPKMYNRDAQVDLAKLRAYRPDVPIGVSGDPNSAIGQPNYRPQYQAAFQVYSAVKQQMREASGATDAIQGLGLGTKRLSATEASGQFDQASQRPSLFAQIVEREYLPPTAKYKMELYREFLEDTEDLRQRIGASNVSVSLGDILFEYDFSYVGTRLGGTRADELAMLREIMAAGANPMVAQLIPWIPLLQQFLDKRGSHDIAAMVGNPQMMKMHLALHQIVAPNTNQQTGNDNGTTPDNPPALLPQQLLGGIS